MTNRTKPPPGPRLPQRLLTHITKLGIQQAQLLHRNLIALVAHRSQFGRVYSRAIPTYDAGFGAFGRGRVGPASGRAVLDVAGCFDEGAGLECFACVFEITFGTGGFAASEVFGCWGSFACCCGAAVLWLGLSVSRSITEGEIWSI